MQRPALALVAAVALATGLLVGCSHQIGDHCTQNVDCDPLGTRFCDLSAPAGYCTIEGCDVATCPSEAVCVRFFEPIATRPCDPTKAGTTSGCDPSERCLCDCSDPTDSTKCVAPMVVSSGDGGVVIRCPGQALPDGSAPMSTTTVAHCAPETSERRWCQKKCNQDGDCQVGYECRQTGTHGSEPVPAIADSGATVESPAKFCVQAGS